MASEEIFPDPTECSEELFFEKHNLGQAEQEVETETEIETEVVEEEPVLDENLETAADEEQSKTDEPSTTNAKEKNAEKSNEPRLTQLPLARIRNLMKLDPDLQIASLEAVFMVTKATEMFIDSLAKEAFVHTSQAKKKTVQKRDVDLAIASVDSLVFLEGAMNF